MPCSSRRPGRHHFLPICVSHRNPLPIAGIWPRASIAAFQAVTDTQTDHLVTGRQPGPWLAMTVAIARNRRLAARRETEKAIGGKKFLDRETPRR
jgi:hypothetical protein